MIQALKAAARTSRDDFSFPRCNYPMTAQPQRPAFGTVSDLAHGGRQAYARSARGARARLKPVGTSRRSARRRTCCTMRAPASKVSRRSVATDGSVHVFQHGPPHRAHAPERAPTGAARSRMLKQLADMVRSRDRRAASDAVPEAPGALYLRPMLFGTTANIGAAATRRHAEASLIVLASPGLGLLSPAA